MQQHRWQQTCWPGLHRAAWTSGCISILHPDGSMSRQQQGAVILGAGNVVKAAGWRRISSTGSQTWALDGSALQRMQDAAATASKQAEAAAAAAAEAAAAAAAAAEAAAAAAAAEASSKKGKAGQKPAAKASAAATAAPGDSKTSADVAAAAPAPNAAGAADTSVLMVKAAQLQEVVQHLQALAPEELGHIRAAQLTDPDTQALVVTREDHLLAVNYPDGSR